MTREQAETAVAGSALIVGGIYSYRKLVESSLNQTPKTSNRFARELGYGPPPPVGRFITAWGFVYILIALVAQASPNLGGSFAVLLATGDILGNGVALADDVQAQLGRSRSPDTAGGIPVYDPSRESPHDYDKRLGAYLRAHPDANLPGRDQLHSQLDDIEQREQAPDPLIPGNPLGGSPFPSPNLR